jgi:hypothetical protein
MTKRPSDPRLPDPLNTPNDPPSAAPEQRTPNTIADAAPATIESTLSGWTRDSEEFASMLAQALEYLREERKLLQDDLAAATRSQQSLSAAARRLEPLASRTRTDSATAIEAAGVVMSKARKQLWDEADAFRRSVRREIRWLIRAPFMAVVLLSIVCGLLWNALPAERRSKADVPVEKPILRLEKPRR